MKNLFNRATDRPIKTLMNTTTNQSTWNAQQFFYLMILFSAFLFSACKKYDTDKQRTNSEELVASNNGIKNEAELLTNYRELDPRTLSELQQVHAATAKYQNINNA